MTVSLVYLLTTYKLLVMFEEVVTKGLTTKSKNLMISLCTWEVQPLLLFEDLNVHAYCQVLMMFALCVLSTFVQTGTKSR